MSDQKNLEKIDAYLNGELEGAELTAFEKAIENNKDLAAQVRLVQGIDAAVGDEGALNFQKMIQEEDEHYYKESSNNSAKIRSIGGRRRVYLVAAVLLTLAISQQLISALY